MQASACASPGKAKGGTGAPPPEKNTQGGEGGGAREQPTATKPPANPTRGGQTPHPEGTEDRTPKRGTGGPPSQNRQHQARNSGPPGKGTPKHADTHHAGKKKEPAAQPEREGMGGQGPQGPGQGQPATNTTKQNQDTPKKKRKKHTPTTQPSRAGHSRDLGPARTPTHRTPARRGREQAGRAHKHAPPHSNPNQEVQETTRDGRTSTHTPQHPTKKRLGAAKTQTPALTPTPHTGTGNGGGQAERARNHTRPIRRPKPKPNHEHHKQQAKEGQHHKPCPNTPVQDPS